MVHVASRGHSRSQLTDFEQRLPSPVWILERLAFWKRSFCCGGHARICRCGAHVLLIVPGPCGRFCGHKPTCKICQWTTRAPSRGLARLHRRECRSAKQSTVAPSSMSLSTTCQCHECRSSALMQAALSVPLFHPPQPTHSHSGTYQDQSPSPVTAR